MPRGCVVEVTVRTLQSQYLLRPDPALNIREILAGEPIRGLWFDRTREFAAKNRGEDFGRLQYAAEEVFELTPLPCWAHLPPEVYRQRIAELMEEIESEAAAELAAAGR